MLGGDAFAARARDELRALGATQGTPAPAGTRRPDAAGAADRELAAGGMTNHQIAEQLVLSHRTIGSHLYQIFPKLGISLRRPAAGRARGVVRAGREAGAGSARGAARRAPARRWSSAGAPGREVSLVAAARTLGVDARPTVLTTTGAPAEAELPFAGLISCCCR